MTKDEILKKHKQYLFPSIFTYYADPLVTGHASMQYLWDTDGNRYLDFFGGIVTISVGHCNPRITEKVKAQVDRLQHASTVFPNEGIVALAEKLAQIKARYGPEAVAFRGSLNVATNPVCQKCVCSLNWRSQ